MNRAGRLAVFLDQQREGLRFCVRFALFTVLAFAILYAAQDVLVAPVNSQLAWVSGHLLRLFGAPASSRGPVVSLGRFGVEIKNNCNAVYEIGLFAAAVWAYPASWRERLTGTLAGGAVLYLVNVLRVLTLLALGLFHPSWFEATHLYAWQALFLVVVAACWLAWLSRVRPVA